MHLSKILFPLNGRYTIPCPLIAYKCFSPRNGVVTVRRPSYAILLRKHALSHLHSVAASCCSAAAGKKLREPRLADCFRLSPPKKQL